MRRETMLTEQEIGDILLMRNYQKLYFTTRDLETLYLALKMENRVDAILARLIRDQREEQLEMFEPGAPQ